MIPNAHETRRLAASYAQRHHLDVCPKGTRDEHKNIPENREQKEGKETTQKIDHVLAP